MTDSDMPSPSEPPTPSQPFRWPKSVSEAKLELVRVRLASLICTVLQANAEVPPPNQIVAPTCRGELVDGSMAGEGFRATVSWSLDADGITITGAYVLTFLIGALPFDEYDAKYYSQTNSVILVYPYIRQIIDDLSVKCLGRNLMVRTLDVPKFVQERMKALMESNKQQEPSSQVPASGNGNEGT